VTYHQTSPLGHNACGFFYESFEPIAECQKNDVHKSWLKILERPISISRNTRILGQHAFWVDKIHAFCFASTIQLA
jgi:hypothetical protein